MTDHGFIGTRAGSQQKVDDVARKISEINGVIFAHIVEGPDYNIIVEFDPRPPKGTHEDFIERILMIPGMHKERTDGWRIIRSYKKGKTAEKLPI